MEAVGIEVHAVGVFLGAVLGRCVDDDLETGATFREFQLDQGSFSSAVDEATARFQEAFKWQHFRLAEQGLLAGKLLKAGREGSVAAGLVVVQ